MKKLAAILILALVAGLLGYALARVRFEAAATAEVETGADIAWLKDEFHLTAPEFAAIEALHQAYSGICAQHCAGIVEARDRLAKLEQEGAESAAIEPARRELLRLEAVCNEATRAHLRQVATRMPLEQGVRFLRATEPHLASSPHDGSRALSR
ncbi:MAG: hypothetical protein ACREIA_10460 [Opitutaceae bacterium]